MVDNDYDDSSWLNSSIDNLMLFATLANDRQRASYFSTTARHTTTTITDLSFAEYDSRVGLKSNSSANNISCSSFRSGVSHIDDSETTLDIVSNNQSYSNHHHHQGFGDSMSSFDLACFFNDELLVSVEEPPMTKRVRFGTVTIREFSMVHEDDVCKDAPSFDSCSQSGRLTSDWDHEQPDLVTWLPSLGYPDDTITTTTTSNSKPYPQRMLSILQPNNRKAMVHGWNRSQRNVFVGSDSAPTKPSHLRTIEETSVALFPVDHAQAA
jgi:hypothetical protein